MNSTDLTLGDFKKYPIAYPVDHSDKATKEAHDLEETDEVQAPPQSPKTMMGHSADIAAQSWKGKDTLVPYAAKPGAVAGVDANAPATRSWWQSTKDNLGAWWSGEEPADAADPAVDQIKTDRDGDIIDYKPNIPTLPVDETDPIKPTDSIEETNTTDKIPPDLEPFETPTVPTHDENGVPVESELFSLRQMCVAILDKKSKHIENKFEEKKNEWLETHEKVKNLKNILRLLPKCKKADGSLDLNVKNADTTELVKHLEKHYNGAAFDRQHTAEKYDEFFNTIKQAQDDHSFNNSAVAEEMKQFSTERAELHQMMFSVMKSDADTCRSLIQKIAR